MIPDSFDPTAGERARAIRRHPAEEPVLTDPTDPRQRMSAPPRPRVSQDATDEESQATRQPREAA
jgi:hypothetical protein